MKETFHRTEGDINTDYEKNGIRSSIVPIRGTTWMKMRGISCISLCQRPVSMFCNPAKAFILQILPVKDIHGLPW